MTTDEIRQRVEAADRARIQSRSDAAGTIALAVERRTRVRADLADLDASITALVREPAAFMTVDELAEFTGIPVTDLPTNGRAGRGRKTARVASPRGRTPRTPARTRTAEKPTPQDTAGDAAQPSA